jgi:DNA-binding response OmpR family regulator
VARVTALFDDLLLGSNVVGWLQAGGHEVTLVSDPAGGSVAGAEVLVVDLGSTGFDGVALVEGLRAGGELAGTRTLGVYSHVDADTRARALDAGFDLVVPRSRLARERGALVDGLVA